jgi:hypothetical protein
MANFSDYLEDQLLTHIFRTSSYTKPTTLAIALLTSAATDSDTGASITEVSNANAYARQTLNPLDANWTLTSGTSDNASAITFPQATGNWGTIVGVAIVDSATYGAGNMLFHGTLAENKTVNNGDTFSFDIGDLNITLD